jgi:murein DD-endopeptidase MepM/ murein hydrolase activator NlpD
VKHGARWLRNAVRRRLPGGRLRDLRLVVLALAVLALAGQQAWPAPGPPPPAQAAAPLYLPWQAGARMFTLQGQNQGTHQGFTSRYAFDFTPDPFKSTAFQVRAAREGKVSLVIQDFPDSPDCNPAFNNQTNLLVVDHGDGTSALYLHLARNSVIPAVGATVRLGDPLAMTGHSGFVCGPAHLHFTVMDSKSWESRDVPFVDPDAVWDGGRPQSERWYTSANAGGRSYRVALPFAGKRVRPALGFQVAAPQDAGGARAP